MNCQAGLFAAISDTLTQVTQTAGQQLQRGVEATKNRAYSYFNPATNDQLVSGAQGATGKQQVAEIVAPNQNQGPIPLAFPNGDVKVKINPVDGKAADTKPVQGAQNQEQNSALKSQSDGTVSTDPEPILGPQKEEPSTNSPSRSPPRTRNLFRRAFWTQGRKELALYFSAGAILATFLALFIAMAAGALPK